MLAESTIVATLYPAMGEAATYNGSAVTVVPEWEPSNFGDVLEVPRQDAPTFRVRKSEIASPAKGATIIYSGVTYTLESHERITETEWRLYVRS